MGKEVRKPEQDVREKSRSGGELGLIRAIQRRATAGKSSSRGELRLGIGDDCAILRPRRGEEIVVTTDFSLEGRHFRREWHTPESIGHRTLARGLSDLAAMGARPVAAFLSLALPREVAQDRAWVDGFLNGLLALADRAPVPLAGGDTSEAPASQVLADIVLLGAVPQGRALRRNGARPGDRLCVTGKLGGAAAQLGDLMDGNPIQPASARRVSGDSQPHFFPEPRLLTGQRLLQKRIATAAIDLSDGLSTDLHHLCESSDVAAEIETNSLPLHTLLSGKSRTEALQAALHGGEDYELLFTVRPGTSLARTIGGVVVTEIGRIVTRRAGRARVTLIDDQGKRTALQPGGWEHLR